MRRHRYNQSRLPDPDNYQPHRQFGRILLQRGAFDEAVRHRTHSRPLTDDRYQEVALLVDLGTSHFIKAVEAKRLSHTETLELFHAANEYYSEATTLDPTYGNGWRRWAMPKFEEGDYARAWEKVNRARDAAARPFPDGFIRALRQKMPKPG